jgi:hypothetical protein
MSVTNHPIDAVITWVDGSDQHHQKKKERILKAEKPSASSQKNILQTGRDQTRFRDNGELKYCLESIRKFAPWIRTIHLVTDNQVPPFLTAGLQKELDIKIVDHTDVFRSYEWALPTFNSRTIETALWRIPGIADRFIYLNDDFILTSPVEPEDFFVDDRVVLRGEWNSIREYGPMRLKLNNWVSSAAKKLLGITRSMHLLLQIRSAQLAGFQNRYFRAHHLPHPVRTNTLRKFYEGHKELFEQNIRYRFRSTDQFSSIYLANHLEISQNRAILDGLDDYLMINGEMDFSFLIDRKLQKILNRDASFVCLQGFEYVTQKNRIAIEETFDRVLAR